MAINRSELKKRIIEKWATEANITKREARALYLGFQGTKTWLHLKLETEREMILESMALKLSKMRSFLFVFIILTTLNSFIVKIEKLFRRHKSI